MATVTGGMMTTNVLSDQLAIDLGDRISLLEPSAVPLTVFSRRARKSKTVATSFGWLEDVSKARFDAVNNGAGYASGATQIVVDNGAYFAQWDQVIVTRTGEQMRVDSVSTNTLTVVRGIGSTAAAIVDNDELYIIGSAQSENDTSKTAASDVPSKVTNNTQIFRTPFEASDSLRASGFQVAPAEWNRQSQMKAIEHSKDIELSILLGRKSANTVSGKQNRTTGGALSFISTNQTDAGGDLTEVEWNAFLLQQGRYSTQSKLALCSGVGLSSLQKFPAGKMQWKQDESSYGINVGHFYSPFGSLNCVWHRLLEGTKYGGYIVVLDMDEVAYRYLGNDELSRDTKVLTNRQPNDQDGRKDELLTECGLQFGQQRKHGVLTGITS